MSLVRRAHHRPNLPLRKVLSIILSLPSCHWIVLIYIYNTHLFKKTKNENFDKWENMLYDQKLRNKMLNGPYGEIIFSTVNSKIKNKIWTLNSDLQSDYILKVCVVSIWFGWFDFHVRTSSGHAVATFTPKSTVHFKPLSSPRVPLVQGITYLAHKALEDYIPNAQVKHCHWWLRRERGGTKCMSTPWLRQRRRLKDEQEEGLGCFHAASIPLKSIT